MSHLIPGGFKAVLYHDQPIPELPSTDLIQKCSDSQSFRSILEQNHLSVRVLACTSEIFRQLPSNLVPSKLDTIYFMESSSGASSLLTNENAAPQPIGVLSEKELILRVLLDVVDCFYRQSINYRTEGNNGLADACRQVVVNVLEYIKEHNEYLCPP
ncbi:unnamed protein product [Adineta ricciae]|uniref:Uncharacterized protein n=1 Tax=Adineta ricciae TaxID=249248 RepID=A0A815B617_ADIRI|nr:unnamed protein product [Adineta ricciae]CAF1265453.1 unnamed protein product [Adineta ricciae]